jgi:hypothetical protein
VQERETDVAVQYVCTTAEINYWHRCIFKLKHGSSFLVLKQVRLNNNLKFSSVSQKTHCVITKTNRLMLFRGKIAVSSKTHSGKSVNLTTVGVGGKYNNNHYAFIF